MKMDNIRVEGVDTDGSAVWYDAWDGETWNSGEPPTTEEIAELTSSGWDGFTKPWIIPDE